MKFENPIMNISMFEVENVVTDSSNLDSLNGELTAAEYAAGLKSSGEVTEYVTITF